MALRPPSRTTRDANLDALSQATSKWGDEEKKRLENETKFIRSVVKGRGAAEKAGSANLATAGDLLQVEINQFIEFGPDTQR